MSFIYSRALVAEYSRGNCLGTEQSAPSSGSHTPKPCLWHDKTMEPSRLSRFGMMCSPLTGDHGAELLTLFVAAFHVRTLALQEVAPASMAKGQACGTTWRESLAKYDHASHSLKTAQLSLLEDLTGCCVTLPRWGLMLDGELYQQPIAVPRTGENESGLWQTPVADDAVNRAKGKWNSRGEPKLSAQVMKWPTPNACKASNDLNLNCSGDGREKPNKLGWAVTARQWPTATATAYKGWSPNHNRADTDDRLDYSVERESYQPGQQTPPMRLNPDWVEWLMGWPIGHTDLKPLATAKYQEWQQQHSPRLNRALTKAADEQTLTATHVP